MTVERKSLSVPAVRIETSGFAHLVPPYGGSLDQLPAAFWATFAESLAVTASEELLDPEERLLLDAARDFAYQCGRDVSESWPWAPFLTPLDSEDATEDDVLHALVATLGALGLDGCRVVELVPFERLVLRVPMAEREPSPLCGALVPAAGPSADRRVARARELEVCGFCTGVMELAYGGPYEPGGRRQAAFKCRRSTAAATAEGSEFIVSRCER